MSATKNILQRLICAGLAVWCVAGWRACAAPAAPDANTEKEAPAAADDEFDDAPTRLQPVAPRTGAEEARLDALAWFGVGRTLEQRGDKAGAMRSYRKALERDPTAAPVYRAAIPLAIELRLYDDAAKWAARAVELLPDDQHLLMQTAALMLGRDDRQGAIHVLEQAVRVKGMNKQSAQYVLLMRDLGLLYWDAERKEAAAGAFEVVLDALLNPEKYDLNPRAKQQLHSGDLTSFEKLGEIFLETGKTDLALKAFQKAAESRKGPVAANVSYNLARAYLQAGRSNEALDEIQKYVDGQRQAKGRAAYELMAQILEKLGRSNELLPRLEAASEKDSRNSTLSYFLADQYAAAGRLTEAETLFKRTLEGSAEAAGYLGLAGVYRRQGKPDALVSALGRAYTEAGDLKGLQTEFKAIIADDKLLTSLLDDAEQRLKQNPAGVDFAGGYVLANLAADAKRTDAAEKLYRFLLSLRQKERTALLFEELGGHYHDVRRYADAAKVYQEAIDDPALAETRPNFQFLLTQELELAGDTKRALATIAQAQEAIPNNPLLRFQEAWVYYHSHQFDEAIVRFERLLAEFNLPQFRTLMRRVQYSLSNVHVLKGEMAKGEEILERIYRENPEEISVNNDLGYLYADQGKNLEQAEEMIRKAVNAEPENAAYLDSLGWVLFKRGKYAEALPYLEKALKISTGGGDETLWDHLGDIYDRLQQPAKAIEAWQKAVELAKQAAYPDSKLIERAEEKITNLKQDEGRLKPARPGAP
ncbi:MAG: tetratricopeptide repeat protein [Planctomycetaceae bacterium]